MTNVQVILAEIDQAVDEVADRNPEVMVRFMEAYRERTKVQEFNESRSQDGLTFALADLLWLSVPKSYFDLSRCRSSGRVQTVPVDLIFMDDLHLALRKVAKQYPHVILSLRKDQQEEGCTLVNLLTGLFSFYADNKKVCHF